MDTTPKTAFKDFRQALGAFTTGVTIVTTQNETKVDIGLTVNSFSAVSLDPPMVLWSLAHSAHSRDSFLQAEGFAVHILAADQTALSAKFATKGADKFSGLLLERGLGGVPLLDGCAARFQCKTVFRYAGGDHDILVGEVVSFEHFDRPPLVFQAGKYGLVMGNPVATETVTETTVFERGLGPTTLTYLISRAHLQLNTGVRPELAQCELSEVEYYILFSLAFYGSATVTHAIDTIASFTGAKLSKADFDKLAQRGLIEFSCAGDKQTNAQLTPAGRDVMVRIAAKSQAVESAALIDINYAEVQVLKQILRKIINRTNYPWMDPL